MHHTTDVILVFGLVAEDVDPFAWRFVDAKLQLYVKENGNGGVAGIFYSAKDDD